MAVDLLMDILDGTHLTILDTADHGPTIVFGSGSAGLAAGGKICHVLLVDVGIGVGHSFAVTHQLFGEVCGNI